ncbi:MAG: hypothetical protein B5M56_09500 [Desulfococcus sp. 4484_241]|nr:MAG: hypothetical protein B5M56_09500 [Desulfococcus sp. 4484_241]
MGILEKLWPGREKRIGAGDIRVQTIRFRKLLENANGLLGLFDDGHEKLGGDYILDSHYVASLVDGIIEKLGMIVHDGCVLSPGDTETLYARYDEHKTVANGFIARSKEKTAVPKPTAGSGSEPEDPVGFPEYRLLADVLEWCNGETSGRTVMDLVKQSVVRGLQELDELVSLEERKKKGVLLEAPGGGEIRAIELWAGSEAFMPRPARFDVNESLPLKLLLMGAGDSPDGSGSRWTALVDRDELSLSCMDEGKIFRMDVTASGHRNLDYVFLFADKGWEKKHDLPGEFRIESTDRGMLAWMFDVPVKAIEDSLITIGRTLFCATS